MKCGKTTTSCAALVLAAFAALIAAPACADPVADFYKGKRVSLFVGSDAGGGYDAYARLVARHLGRFIPGNPDLIVQNMPGGGGLRVTNHLYNVAAKDGTALGTMQRAILAMPLLDARNIEIKFDPLKFNWLGSLNTETGLILAGVTAPHKHMKDLFEKELVIASSGPSTDYMPLFLNKVLGTKFKIIAGYKSSNDAYLALQRGEVQGRVSNGWAGDKATLKPAIEQKQVTLLAQLALVNSPIFPDVPLVLDFARTEREKQAMELILSSSLWGRPFIMPPDVPKERFEAVRKAFADMMNDAEFLADARKANMDIEAVPGEDIEALLRRVYATPPDIVEFVRKAIAAESK